MLTMRLLRARSCLRGSRFVQALSLAAFLAGVSAPAWAAQGTYGSFGPEGARMREQLWLLPSDDPKTPLRATLFRPAEKNAGGDKFPLVVINHGTDDATRLAVSMPVYYWLSRWFIERGYAVLLPQRRGHGATGGPLAEAVGNCDDPDHYASGLQAARDLDAAIAFIKDQDFIDRGNVIVAGISTGGWASLALAALDPGSVRAVVSFAGGRGGHAHGRRNAVCGEDRLVAAAQEYGKTARAPSIWFYAKNDSYFGPSLAEALAQAWSAGGGLVEARILPSYGAEGHGIADDRAGWDLWGPALERFLARLPAPADGGVAALQERDAGTPLAAHIALPASMETSGEGSAKE